MGGEWPQGRGKVVSVRKAARVETFGLQGRGVRFIKLPTNKLCQRKGGLNPTLLRL